MKDLRHPAKSLYQNDLNLEDGIIASEGDYHTTHTPSALNAGAKRSGATCHMAMPQCCYLARERSDRTIQQIFKPLQITT